MEWGGDVLGTLCGLPEGLYRFDRRLGVCKTRHFFYLIVYGLDASNTTRFKSILPLFGLFRCNYLYNCLC